MTEAGKRLHVVAAAILDPDGRVLITRRPPRVHQGGLWEFPGGKLEQGETPRQALQRELLEELGIIAGLSRPLIRVRHDYPDKHILLDVWLVADFTGTPSGREGQPLAWVGIEALQRYSFPTANIPVIRALQLPDRYLITPEPDADQGAFLETLGRAIGRGVSLVQLRAKRLPEAAFRQLAQQVAVQCQAGGARLLLNCDPQLVPALGAQGVHLSAARLMGLGQRPLGPEYLVAASCHNRMEVARAGDLGLDFIVISPVRDTASHPGVQVLGFDGLHALCECATVPAYALGGMRVADIDAVRLHGAQGIAAIRGLWPRGTRGMPR